MIFNKLLFLVLIVSWARVATGKITVLTTTSDLKSITEEVGGTEVEVESFCQGAQDPHFLEAKPSYMQKTNHADLVIAIGLGLEVGWLSKVLSGGRNPNVMDGKNGYLEVGPLVQVLEVPKGPVSRADGDVHPEGNPHVTLDPIRVAQIGEQIAIRLSILDLSHAEKYKQNAALLKARLENKTKSWQQRIDQTTLKKVVTHHKTLSYFFDRFGIQNVAILEPFPGVPPTAPHVLSVINTSAKEGVKLLLVENYFDDSVAKRVARDVPGVRVESVPVSVGGTSEIKNVDDLFENLVRKFESGKSK